MEMQLNKTYKLRNQRKRLSCPRCNYRVIDEGIGTSSELHIMKDCESWNADYYTKCGHCKAEIGVRKIE